MQNAPVDFKCMIIAVWLQRMPLVAYICWKAIKIRLKKSVMWKDTGQLEQSY